MKTFLVVAMLLSSISAFAQAADVYVCEALKNSSGVAPKSNKTYSVSVNQNAVVLQKSVDKKTAVSQTTRKSSQMADAAQYKSGDVTITVVSTPILGKVKTTVSIVENSGGNALSASCFLAQIQH
jgi:hypothetical protein